MEAFIELLKDEGMKCFEKNGIYKIKSVNGDLVTSLKLGDGCVMSTHEVFGFETEPTYHGNTWNYYIVI